MASTFKDAMDAIKSIEGMEDLLPVGLEEDLSDDGYLIIKIPVDFGADPSSDTGDLIYFARVASEAEDL